MTDSPAGRLTWDKITPIAMSAIGLAVVLGSALRADGGQETKLAEQIADRTRRIERLEAADSAKTDLLRTIDGRTIRIETKLELIVPAKGASQ